MDTLAKAEVRGGSVATGIPSGNGNRSNDFRIEYGGKSSYAQVLATAPSRLRRIVHIDGSPINRIIYGDNLPVLRSLCEDPSVLGKVRLVYIDPPYATQARFESRTQVHAYDDQLSGARYLEYIRKRLIILRDVLALDGSIYVHLDDTMVFPVKVIMDEIFGLNQFRNVITRKKCNPKNYTRRQYGNVADYILFYTKTNDYVWNQPFVAWTDETASREYQYADPGTGRLFKKVPVHAPGVRNGATGREWRGKLPPPGKHWQYPPDVLDELDRRGEIYWSPTGNPRRKIYLDESKGIPVQDIWMDFKDAHNQNVRITGYPTEKNRDMLVRLVTASSNKGDLVLDAFAGAGTTAVAAETLARSWIAVDNSIEAIRTMISHLATGPERMGDFVNGRHASTVPMFKTGRLLRTGLDIYADEGDDMQSVTTEQIAEWYRLLAND